MRAVRILGVIAGIVIVVAAVLTALTWHSEIAGQGKRTRKCGKARQNGSAGKAHERHAEPERQEAGQQL